MKYIAILRGINVSGQKKIKMTDLKKILSGAGLDNVETYIQSGNVIFEHASSPSELEKLINEIINQKYGFKVPTLVKSANDLEYAIKKNDFIHDPSKDDNRIFFTFLAEEPDPDKVQDLKKFNFQPEEIIINGKDIFIYVPNGYGRAKLNNNFIESKLKVSASTRNLNTIKKLVEMAKK